MSLLRVSRLLERSAANGPGERFVVWVQGCSLHCPGCFNPGTWDPRGGSAVEIAALAGRINRASGLRGITLSGGEPLEQPEALRELLSLLDPRLDRVLFTGFAWPEIQGDPRRAALAREVDLLVAGRYLAARRSEGAPWAGSENKTVLALTGRVPAGSGPACRIEAQIAPDGRLSLTGFPPPELIRELSSPAPVTLLSHGAQPARAREIAAMRAVRKKNDEGLAREAA
ncbi:MAG: radical SAM protein [Elusimicrobia bacterium]|nr:radical SAM protein [Elusimicrobiota bacterium]